MPISTFRVPHDKPFDRNCWFGAHQPQEIVDGNVLCVTWFAGGLRAVDISDVYRPAEIGYFMPTPANGMPVQSNDVYFEKRRGLIYVIDRFSGLDILEYRG